MPATPKSFLPAFTGFIGTSRKNPPLPPPYTPFANANPAVFAFSYTFIVASKEGAAMDNARTRWQHQHASARNVLSGGVTGVQQGQ